MWATVLFVLSELGVFRTSVWLALNDKIVHVALYAVLGATLAWGKRRSGVRWPHWRLVALGIGYGILDELHQRFTPGRIPSGADAAADALGVLAGYCLVLAVWHLVGRTRSRPAPLNEDA